MLFSSRTGYKKVKDIIQIESIDDELRNGLWDAICIHYLDLHKEYSHEDLDLLIKMIWHLYFKKPIDIIPYSFSDIYKYLREYYYNCKWYEVFDFIEFISSYYNYEPSRQYERAEKNNRFRSYCNKVLERENSGYRFIDGYVTQITTKIEIDCIEQALTVGDKFKTVNIHLDAALKLLTDKKNPDFRNSIKESISSVEALCIIISQDKKATLGKALKMIEEKYNIHTALKGAFEKLYGYTSDSDGIRHGLLEEANLTYQDALYLLVTCSAFINYLINKITK